MILTKKWVVTYTCFIYLLQEPEILQPQSNEILTAIVHGMKKEEPRYVFAGADIW